MAGRFQAYEVALEMASAMRPTLLWMARQDKNLEDQLRRAAASVVLNIAEGARRVGKDRLHLYRVAAGSAAELRSGLSLAIAWGYLDPTHVEAVVVLLDRVLAMLWLGLSPSGLRPGRATHAALFTCGKWWRLTHRR